MMACGCPFVEFDERAGVTADHAEFSCGTSKPHRRAQFGTSVPEFVEAFALVVNGPLELAYS